MPSVNALPQDNSDYDTGDDTDGAYEYSDSLDAICNALWRLETGVADMEATLTARAQNSGVVSAHMHMHMHMHMYTQHM